MYSNNTTTPNLNQVKKPNKSHIYNNMTFCRRGKTLLDPHQVVVQDKTLPRRDRLHIMQFYNKELNPNMTPEQLLEQFKSMCPRRRLAFNHIIYLASQGLLLEPSQKRIGYLVDIGRQQVNKHFAQLKHSNMLDIYTRGKHKTAVYRLAPIFYERTTWELLQDYLPVFKSLVLGLMSFYSLLSQPVNTMERGSRSQKVTVLNISKTTTLGSSSFTIGSKKQDISAHARESGKFSTESKMTPITEHISSYLNLTLAGQCKAQAFGDEILSFVDAKCNQGTTLRNSQSPHIEFFRLCEERCAEFGMKPNWKRMFDAQRLHGVDDKDRVLAVPAAAKAVKAEKGVWNCKNGCPSGCDGWNLAHDNRAMAKKDGREYKIPPVEEINPCPLKCIQPCEVNGVFTDEHQRYFKNGLNFIHTMVPSALRDEVEMKFNAQFIKKKEEPISRANEAGPLSNDNWLDE